MSRSSAACRRGSSNPAAVDDTSLQQPVRKIAPQHRADLRDFARFAEPVEPRGERLLQGRRDRLGAALRVALEQESRHLLDEQRDAARSLAHSVDHLVGKRMPACDLADHPADLRAVERRERNDAVVRAHGPGRAELRPRRRHDEQSGACAPRSASDRMRSSEVGSAQCRSSKTSTTGCVPRARQIPRRHRRELPSPQFLRREFRRTLLGQRNVDQRRDQGRVFGRVEADQT